MTRGSIAAFVAGAGCMLAAAGAAGSYTSTIAQQDSKAKSNARNMTSQVESCWAEWQDYRRCRSAAVLNKDAGQYAVPIGTHRGQVRVSHARRDSYTIDAWSRSGNHFLMVKRPSGAIVRKCTTADRGGCYRNGRW
jgi:type IV pilus assembly protein PilA